MTAERRILAGAILYIGLVWLACPVWAANYTLSVNAATKTGAWDRFYERSVAMDHMYTVINSAYNRNTVNALRKAHDEAGFQSVRGHGILDADVGVYSENSSGQAVYTWTKFDQIYDSIKAVGMRPLVEIGFMPPALAAASTTISGVWYNSVPGNWNAPKDWTKWGALVKELIRHCKQRYGEAEVRNWFFELWNEPNWMYSGGGGYTGWKTLYQHTAQAVREEDSLIKLGGPAESAGSSNSAVPDFMQWTKQNGIKADFCSYHVYSNDYGEAFNCNAPNIIDYYQRVIVAAKKTYNFGGLLLNTEFGPSFSSGGAVLKVHDGEAAASFLAKTIHLFNLNASTVVPPYTLGYWAVSDIYEEYDNRSGSPAFSGCYGLLTRGVASIPQSWDLAKPVFNAYALLHKMKNTMLSVSGGTTASPGVNLAATVSAGNDTICILIYNHVDNADANSATVDSVTLTVSNIPFTKVKAEHWVVDRTRSNAYQAWINLGSPQNPSDSQWTTLSNASRLAYYDTPVTSAVTGGSYSKKIAQNFYSVGLLQLTNANQSAVVKPASGAGPVKPVITDTDTKLTFTLPATPYRIALFSSSGRLVKSVYAQQGGTKQISVRDLSPGLYMVECRGKSQRLLKSIIVGAGY